MEKGQNYWFNGCIQYLMECLGESGEYDYSFFSGVTGDSFLQIFSKNISNLVLCYTDKFLQKVISTAFDACGYNVEYFCEFDCKNYSLHDGKIKKYIDNNVPVIVKIKRGISNYGIIYGYDKNNYYCIYGENTEEIISPDECCCLIFIKDKKIKPSLAQMYKQSVQKIPMWIQMPSSLEYSFGKQAFIDWADSFQNNAFDNICENDNVWFTHPAENFSCWNMHGTYLCMLGTNNCALGFLEKALDLNPELQFIKELMPIYEKINTKGFNTIVNMQGGFCIKPKVIKNKALMKPISDALAKLALHNDSIIEVFNNTTM
jgi:hypothetical protein